MGSVGGACCEVKLYWLLVRCFSMCLKVDGERIRNGHFEDR